jgi:hypothetical protein
MALESFSFRMRRREVLLLDPSSLVWVGKRMLMIWIQENRLEHDGESAYLGWKNEENNIGRVRGRVVRFRNATGALEEM